MFERLTSRTESGIAYTKTPANESNMVDVGECYTGRIIDRIAAYEDSRLSPNEVQELAKAKAEGRLVVLPCKVGNVVYEPRKDRGIISEYEITEIIINKYGVSFFRWNLKEGIYSHLGGFPVECLGKTVFITREAAEKALEVGE